MPLMRWFHLVLIEKACHTKKLCAGSTRQVALSSTLLSSSPSCPSRNQKCPGSSPPPARRFHQPFDILLPPNGENSCGVSLVLRGLFGGFLGRAPCCAARRRSEEHTSELQSQSNLVCRLLLEKKKHNYDAPRTEMMDNEALRSSLHMRALHLPSIVRTMRRSATVPLAFIRINA